MTSRPGPAARPGPAPSTASTASTAPTAPTASPAAPATAAASLPSALGAALDRVGDRWSLQVVEALLQGPLRYGELAAAVGGIAPNILADRLRRLERAGILAGSPYSQRPLRLEYALTTDGRELAGALRLLADWGSRRGGGTDEPLRHAACGTPLEARWHCPTCARVVDDAGPDELVRL